jgi:hypothetical protein
VAGSNPEGVIMEKKLRRLETFSARGSDGQVYSVHGYEHLGKVDAFIAAQEQWEPMGINEYKLADGRRVDVKRDGTMTVVDTGVQLQR